MMVRSCTINMNEPEYDWPSVIVLNAMLNRSAVAFA